MELHVQKTKQNKTRKCTVPTNKSPGPDGFTGKFYRHIKKNLNSSTLIFFQTIEEGTLPKTFCEATIPLTQNPRKRYHQRRKLFTNTFDKYRHKNSQQNFSQPYPATYKKDHTAWPNGILIPCPQVWSRIHKSKSITHHIKKRKAKIHMITSVDAEKPFDKVQHPFMIKTFTKAGIERTYLLIIKPSYDKTTANTMPNTEKLKAFTLKSGT